MARSLGGRPPQKGAGGPGGGPPNINKINFLNTSIGQLHRFCTNGLGLLNLRHCRQPLDSVPGCTGHNVGVAMGAALVSRRANAKTNPGASGRAWRGIHEQRAPWRAARREIATVRIKAEMSV
jgi:hypothetical protein